jgi:hypothetical protein
LASYVNNPSTGKINAAYAANQSATSNNGVAVSWQVQKPSDASYGVDVSFPTGTVYDDAGKAVTVSDGQAIRTTGYIKTNYAFAGLIGLAFSNIKASATTIVTTEGTVSGNLMVPLIASEKTIFGDGSTWPAANFGQQVTLKVTHWQNDFIGPGNFGAVVLPGMGNGASGYRDALAGNDTTPFVLTVNPPTYLATKPGNMQGPTKQGMSERLGKETDPRFKNDSTAYNNWLAAYNSYTGMFPFTWRIVLVPIVQDPVAPGNGRTQTLVVGMAGFFIESYNKGESVTGRFIQGIQAGDTVRWIFPTNNQATSTQNIIFIKPIS